ncbi:MAG: DUF4186 family protein [Leucobacter sp.]
MNSDRLCERPVFRAQHATATCCRKCLESNHGIEKGRDLDDREREYVVDVLCRWIEVEYTAGAVLTANAAQPVLF